MLKPLCTCRYYRNYDMCMSDWLHSQDNCSSDIVTTILETESRFSLPFTSRDDCPPVSNASTLSFVSFIRQLIALGRKTNLHYLRQKVPE